MPRMGVNVAPSADVKVQLEVNVGVYKIKRANPH